MRPNAHLEYFAHVLEVDAETCLKISNINSFNAEINIEQLPYMHKMNRSVSEKKSVSEIPL